jgi:peroxiredoxin
MKNKKLKLITLIFIFTMLSNNIIYGDQNNVEVQTLDLIPVRETFEKLGYTVFWNTEKKVIEIYNNFDKYILPLNKSNKNNKVFILDNKAYINIDNLKDYNLNYQYNSKQNIEIFYEHDVPNAPKIEDQSIKKEDRDLLNSVENKVIFFWTTWCPYCTKYIKELNQTIDELEDINIIAINIDEHKNKDKVNKFIEENNKDFKNILDPDKKIFNLYKPSLIPTTYVIKENKIIKVLTGPFNKTEILN